MDEAKIPTPKDMIEESVKFADSIPNLREKQKFVNELRGVTIEFSLIIEQCFNHFVTTTGKDLVLNDEKGTFDLITGIRDKKDIPKISTKNRDMEKLLKENFPKLSEEELFIFSNDLKRFWAIRDIFAHVPLNWQSEPLEFITERPYKHFFDLDSSWGNVMSASVEFTGLFQKILDLILLYHHNTLLKKEIYSRILLGKSQKEIREEAKKLNESKQNENEN